MALRSFSKAALLALVLGGVTAGGCGGQKSWLVKPHQRGLLADRIMRLDSNAQERKADQHVFQYREGAIGGDGTTGGGCGCN